AQHALGLRVLGVAPARRVVGGRARRRYAAVDAGVDLLCVDAGDVLEELDRHVAVLGVGQADEAPAAFADVERVGAGDRALDRRDHHLGVVVADLLGLARDGGVPGRELYLARGHGRDDVLVDLRLDAELDRLLDHGLEGLDAGLGLEVERLGAVVPPLDAQAAHDAQDRHGLPALGADAPLADLAGGVLLLQRAGGLVQVVEAVEEVLAVVGRNLLLDAGFLDVVDRDRDLGADQVRLGRDAPELALVGVGADAVADEVLLDVDPEVLQERVALDQDLADVERYGRLADEAVVVRAGAGGDGREQLAGQVARLRL